MLVWVVIALLVVVIVLLFRLQRSLAIPKKRGDWGEMQLETLLENNLGTSPKHYQLQYVLENGKRVDAIIHGPMNRLLCIDAKFPFQMNETVMKHHIDEVAKKYVSEETLPFALLFIPSEGLFQQLCEQQAHLFQYAWRKQVLLVSPTTLMAVSSIVLMTFRLWTRQENMASLEAAMANMMADVDRLYERSSRLEKTSHELAVSSHKLHRRLHEWWDQ